MTPWSVVLRADGGPVVGTGHLMRLLALAQAIRARGGEAVFAVANGLEACSRHRAEGLRMERLDVHAGSAKDAEQTADLAVQEGAQWVVIDSYSFHSDFQEALKKRGFRVLMLDDFGHANFYTADLIVNPNVYATEAFYRARTSRTSLRLGPAYALLRQEFLSAPAPSPSGATTRLLLTFGGGDPQRILPRVAAALEVLPTPLEIACPLGPYCDRRPEIEALTRGSRHIWRLLDQPPEMARLMAWADLAVAAAGTTALELAYMGVPALLVVAAENQVRVAEAMAHAGAAIDLGWHDRLEATQVRRALAALVEQDSQRRAMREAGRALVDGRGAARIAEELQQRSASP